jgi:hypothetical protein
MRVVKYILLLLLRYYEVHATIERRKKEKNKQMKVNERIITFVGSIIVSGKTQCK